MVLPATVPVFNFTGPFSFSIFFIYNLTNLLQNDVAFSLPRLLLFYPAECEPDSWRSSCSPHLPTSPTSRISGYSSHHPHHCYQVPTRVYCTVYTVQCTANSPLLSGLNKEILYNVHCTVITTLTITISSQQVYIVQCTLYSVQLSPPSPLLSGLNKGILYTVQLSPPSPLLSGLNKGILNTVQLSPPSPLLSGLNKSILNTVQ